MKLMMETVQSILDLLRRERRIDMKVGRNEHGLAVVLPQDGVKFIFQYISDLPKVLPHTEHPSI